MACVLLTPLAPFHWLTHLGIERTAVTYTGLIHACAEGMQLDKAMALFTYMVAGQALYPGAAHAVGFFSTLRLPQPRTLPDRRLQA